MNHSYQIRFQRKSLPCVNFDPFNKNQLEMFHPQTEHRLSVSSDTGVKRMYPEVARKVKQVNRLSIATSFIFFIICVIQLSTVSERIVASNYVVSQQFRNIASQLYPALYSSVGILLFFSLAIPLCGIIGTRNKDKTLLTWFCVMNSCCFIVAAFSIGQTIYLGDLCSDGYKSLPQTNSSCSTLYFVYYVSCILLAILIALFFISARISYTLASHPKLTVMIMEVHHHHTPNLSPTSPQNSQPTVEVNNRRVEKTDNYIPYAVPIGN